jgi:hypothetical protein
MMPEQGALPREMRPRSTYNEISQLVAVDFWSPSGALACLIAPLNSTSSTPAPRSGSFASPEVQRTGWPPCHSTSHHPRSRDGSSSATTECCALRRTAVRLTITPSWRRSSTHGQRSHGRAAWDTRNAGSRSAPHDQPIVVIASENRLTIPVADAQAKSRRVDGSRRGHAPTL